MLMLMDDDMVMEVQTNFVHSQNFTMLNHRQSNQACRELYVRMKPKILYLLWHAISRTNLKSAIVADYQRQSVNVLLIIIIVINLIFGGMFYNGKKLTLITRDYCKKERTLLLYFAVMTCYLVQLKIFQNIHPVVLILKTDVLQFYFLYFSKSGTEP